MEQENRACRQAESQLKYIREMVAQLRGIENPEEEDWEKRGRLEAELTDHPLSILVRDDWYGPGNRSEEGPVEFELLLCTGGPAVRIVGDLDHYCQPTRVRLEYQDWFEPWKPYLIDDPEAAGDLEYYCSKFYFGD